MITKKTLAFFIATGLAMGTLSNASYAINQVEGLNMVVMEEEEAINTFSYEELLDLAMKNSSTLIRQQKQIERSEIMREEAAKIKPILLLEHYIHRKKRQQAQHFKV